MPFGLKNAGSTYQRLVNQMFKDQLGKTMEVYIDDMVVKSAVKTQHLSHLQETFDVLRQYQMRLKPTKCAFGVSSGQFLGHIVNRQGIEPNLEKVEALRNMPSPKTPREVQVLTGRIAALSGFISRLSDRCKPFFRAIQNRKYDVWGPEQVEAFDQLKRYLTSPPILTIPKPGEMLYVYLAITEAAVSVALFREENYLQQPIFYVSKSLIDAEKRYTPAEKLVLASVVTKRKLRQYFEAHTITMLTNQPIKVILSKLDLSGRVTKWTIELGAFDIRYQPRTSKKGQVVADFLVECYPIEGMYEKQRDTIGAGCNKETLWELYADGSSNQAGARVGIVLSLLEGIELEYSIRLDFPTSNNVAEYEALVLRLKIAELLKISNLKVYSNSQLIVNQENEGYATKDERMEAYQQISKRLSQQFKKFEQKQILR
ncbi:unnamed protein product [Prunus armeniaca]